MKSRSALVVATALIIAAGTAGMAITIYQQALIIGTLSDNTTALREQVADNGEIPVAPPPEKVTEEPLAPLDGRDGRDGVDGRDGRTPTAAEVSESIRLYCAANDDCRGVQGIPGLNGANGETVIGPEGDPGPAGSDGAPGPAGADGAPGPAGADGPTGPPGADGATGQQPTSWTYTDMLGTQRTCTRAEPFDPNNPQYTCG